MKAFAYTRVSGDEQAGDDRDGLKRQARDIQSFAAGHDYEIVEVFPDEGVTGTIPIGQRPAFKRLLAALYSNGVKTIIVECADRIARDQEFLLSAVGQLRRDGFTVLTSKGENLTSMDMTDRAHLGMNAVFAEWAKSQLVARLKAARDAKRAQRGWSTGDKPFGMDAARPDEHPIMLEIIKLRSAGRTLQQIVDELNAAGISTRNEKMWTTTQVGRIVKRGYGELRQKAKGAGQ